MAWVPALITAAASVAGGYMASRGSQQKESKIQKRQRHLVDQLIASLGGQGPFSDLFNAKDSTFQKSYVEPAKAMFKNQIAPQIQQQYIAGGQQYGTGLDDQLLRAGVDLDQMLNQAKMEYDQGAMNRKQNAINAILGQSGAPAQQSAGQSFQQAAGGYLSSDAFKDAVSGMYKNNTAQSTPSNTTNPYQVSTRKGYESDWNEVKNYSLNDPRWRMQ